jgi:hypothetical protein
MSISLKRLALVVEKFAFFYLNPHPFSSFLSTPFVDIESMSSMRDETGEVTLPHRCLHYKVRLVRPIVSKPYPLGLGGAWMQL